MNEKELNKTVHTDCFGFNDVENEKEQCFALIERICNCKECKFYKNWDECDKETKRLVLEQKQLFMKKV